MNLQLEVNRKLEMTHIDNLYFNMNGNDNTCRSLIAFIHILFYV